MPSYYGINFAFNTKPVILWLGLCTIRKPSYLFYKVTQYFRKRFYMLGDKVMVVGEEVLKAIRRGDLSMGEAIVVVKSGFFAWEAPAGTEC
jgi:hypothetical protein